MGLEKDFQLYEGDCLELMKTLSDGTIDMILCDLPYGSTACKWDKVIPFEPLWEQYERVIKGSGAIVLFGAEPFSSALRMSRLKLYRYDWIWKKNLATGFANAKHRPLYQYELISVFSKAPAAQGAKNPMQYFPQGLTRVSRCLKNSVSVGGGHIQEGTVTSLKGEYTQEFTNYPKSILEFSNTNKGKVHPTQKPIALLEYLIKTYTNEGETVLDNTMGSGSTGVACRNTGRKFIGMEKDPKYFEIAKKRIFTEFPEFKKEYAHALPHKQGGEG